MKKRYGVIAALILGALSTVSIYGFKRNTPIASKQLNNEQGIIAMVNGEAIYKSDVEEARKKYNETYNLDVSLESAVDSVVKELIVIQEAQKLKLEVDPYEIEDNIHYLKTEMPDFYEVILEQYGTEEVYGEKLKYNYLYDEMRNYVVKDIEIEEKQQEAFEKWLNVCYKQSDIAIFLPQDSTYGQEVNNIKDKEVMELNINELKTLPLTRSKICFEPNTTYNKFIEPSQITNYLGVDIHPKQLPKDLKEELRDKPYEIIYYNNGSIAYDNIVINYSSDSSRNGERKIQVKASKTDIIDDESYLGDEGLKVSRIGDNEVLIGHSQSAGENGATVQDIYVAEFKKGQIDYQIVMEDIKYDEMIAILKNW